MVVSALPRLGQRDGRGCIPAENCRGSSSRSRPGRRSEWPSTESESAWSSIDGGDPWGGCELLIALAERFGKATKDELAPENFPFIESWDLLRRLKL